MFLLCFDYSHDLFLLKFGTKADCDVDINGDKEGDINVDVIGDVVGEGTIVYSHIAYL